MHSVRDAALVQCLQEAIECHERGALQRAEILYQTVLQQAPQHAEALHGLGLLASHRGQHTLAVALIRQAIASQPALPRLHNSLGHVLRQQGQTAAAVAAYQEALRRQPDFALAHYNLGGIWHAQGDLAAARTAYATAVRLQPDFAAAHNNLGVVLKDLGQHTAARAAYETAIRLRPDCAEAYNNLGVVLKDLGQLAAAVTAHETALQLRLEYAEAHYNLGIVREAQGDLPAARAHYQAAVRCQPDYALAHYNLGAVLYALHDLEGARSAYTTVLQHATDNAAAHDNLGVVYRRLGDLDAAHRQHQQALALQPAYAPARWNRALVWLTQGDLAQGWPAYEWRLRTNAPPPRYFPQPRWDGSPLAGRTILVHAEQGVGDELLFASCFPDLIAQAGHVVIECEPRLTALFARSFPTATVHGSDRRESLAWLRQVPPIDVQTPAGSLPLHLRPTLASFPPRAAYLVPDTQRCAHYQQRLAALGGGLKIGIAWRSLRTRQGDPDYPPLPQWRPLCTVPGVHFVNLQYDDPAAELAAAHQQWGITIHQWDDPDMWHDLDGVAALMAALDLVVAPDTTVATLAGSLGCPVWRLTIAGGTWLMLGTEGSPWFPSTRIVRQHRRGQWQDVFLRLAQEVAGLAHSCGQNIPAKLSVQAGHTRSAHVL